MTLEEIKSLNEDEIKARSAEIKAELDNVSDETDVDALSAEVEALESRRAEILAEKETRAADVKAVLEGAGSDITETIPENMEERNMENNIVELRNDPKYVEAFANDLKSAFRNRDSKTIDFAECRALTTELAVNGTAVVPVPQIVYDTVSTAWQKDRITQLVKKTFAKGVLRVAVEVVASEAGIHAEGAAAGDAETLILGIVSLQPQTIKKWIQISDEVLDMDSGAFLQYIYDEITYKIAKKAADIIIGKIVACGTVSTTTPATNVAVPAITTTNITVDLVAQALGNLCDDATSPVVIMNKATWSAFKKVQYAGGFSVDPFEGLEVVFNNSLSSFAAATTGVPFAIVGDLGVGVLANFPNGDDIKIKYDDMDDAEADLVKIVGRLPIAAAVVKENSFCVIKADK